MGQAKARAAQREIEDAHRAELKAAWEARTHCGAGNTGDPYCDVSCQRERGHEGPHRVEWSDE